MKYAICNETFENWDHLQICKVAAQLGYAGLEVAPFTLAPRITDVTQAQRRWLKQQADDTGIQLLGLHWLLARTEGLQLTSADPGVRERTAAYLRELARCCRDLGGDLLVFGSPAQRKIPAGASRAQALEYAADTLRQVLPALADFDVRLCLEPLTPEETDFMTSCAEAMELVERLDHPKVMLHLDVKAMASESTPIPELIRRHVGRAGHFHANDPNRRGPGFGAVDFVPIIAALEQSGYKGWVSVEVFDYTPDPVTIARESIRFLKQCEPATRRSQP